MHNQEAHFSINKMLKYEIWIKNKKNLKKKKIKKIRIKLVEKKLKKNKIIKKNKLIKVISNKTNIN